MFFRADELNDQIEIFLVSRMLVGFIFHKDNQFKSQEEKKVSSFWSWLGSGFL